LKRALNKNTKKKKIDGRELSRLCKKTQKKKFALTNTLKCALNKNKKKM